MQTNFHTKYKVECKIGEGSFSEVLKCQERSSGKFFAAKQLKKHFKSISHATDIPELLVLQKVSKHPNVLELYDSYYDSANGKVILVFELMDMSLYDLMKTRKRPIPESRAKKYLYQIIKGIDHLHYHGIFHRDIKPENVLVKGEKVKISDMGSIKGVYSKQPYTEYISTRWYRSPECLLTKGFYGPKMDVWAIGCVYYELLTLKPLFPGSDEIDQMNKINHVLGSPSAKLINKLKKVKCRNMVPSFPHKKGTGLNSVLPIITDEGREIIKQMIVYDPDSRINIRRLLEHKYFNDMRHEEMMSQKIINPQNSINSSYKMSTSPMWLSFITATRKRRIKRKIVKTSISKKHSIMKTQSNMTRVHTVASSDVSYTNSDEAEGTSNIYSMQPMDIKKYNNGDQYFIHEDASNYCAKQQKIPGYEQFTKKKIQRNFSSKTLLSLIRSKDNVKPEISNQDNSNYFPNDKMCIDQSLRSPKNKFEQRYSSDQKSIKKSVDIIMENRNLPVENIHDISGDNMMVVENCNMLNVENRRNSDNFQNSRLPLAVRFDVQTKKEEHNRAHELSIADMRNHITVKSFQKRRHSYLSKFSENESVNLANKGPVIKGNNNTRLPDDTKFKRFYSGQIGKKTMSHSSFVAPYRKTNLLAYKVGNIKEVNDDRKSSNMAINRPNLSIQNVM